MKREKYLSVKVSDVEREVLQQLADAEQRTVSSYVRWLISLAADRKIALKDSSALN